MGTGGGLVVIDFTETGNSAFFRREGWSGQEPDRVWAIGPRAVLSVPIQASHRPVVLEVELAPGQPVPKIMGQIVRIAVNGTALGHVRIASRTMIRAEIAAALVGQDGFLTIEFGFPGFWRPALAFDSVDERPMSCWFSFVRIYTMDMFKPGPWFPTSHPDIPVVTLSPPILEPPGGLSPGAAIPGDVSEPSHVFYTFGPDGTATPFQDAGWGSGADNLTGTVESAAQLRLPAPRAPGAYAFRLDAAPVVAPGQDPTRNVTVLLDGIVVGQVVLREPATWILPLPRELTDGQQTLRLEVLLWDPRVGAADKADNRRGVPDAAGSRRPSGIAVRGVGITRAPANAAAVERLRAEQADAAPPMATSDAFLNDTESELPAAVKAALGVDAATLTGRFESLGIDPEFGEVQGRLGLHVLNLFGACEGTLTDLTWALTDDLMAATDPDHVGIERGDEDPRGPRLTLPPYNLRWHMFGSQNDTDPDEWRRANAITLGYLRRKFYDGLRSGRKIYVLKQGQPIPAGQAAGLLLELARTGDATLLCVEEAAEGQTPGKVELIMPGLMRGYIERWSHEPDGEAASLAGWLRVLANAALLKRATGAIAVH